MKTLKGIFIAALMVGIVSAPVFALETATGSAPQTLADFQKIYSGTKPMVAYAKYGESQFLKKYPQPALNVSRMSVKGAPVRGQGTKPTVLPARSVNTGSYVPAHRTGTKPWLMN
jgi:hypothetical protein